MNGRIETLPKWAQEHIRDLERARDVAVAVKNKMVDEQTPSPIYVDDWSTTPSVKRYVQCKHNNLVIEHAGVRADILLARKDDGQRLFGIDITYSGSIHSLSHFPVVLMPRSIGNIQLVHKDNL